MAAKSYLKQARDLITKKDFQGASNAAIQVLQQDPANYNAHVFLGLASLELGDLKRSQEAYESAIRQNRTLPLAWQGITKLYERQEQWDRLAESLLTLTELFSDLKDAIKCAENLSKYINLQKQHGNRRKQIDSLSLLLDTSPYYGTLSDLPEPDATAPTGSTVQDVQEAIYNSLPVLQEIIELTEQDESETIAQEVQKRRTRLGASPLEILKKEVRQEIWSSSKLETLYLEVLSHPRTSDELRRSTEACLLQRRRERLLALPADDPKKEKLWQEVMEMVNGMVLLKIPNDLAWGIYFETQDLDVLSKYSLADMHTLLNILPQSPLSQLWRAWLNFEGLPESDDPEHPPQALDTDPVDLATDLEQALPESILVYRILAFFHWKLQDYENAIRHAESGLKSLSKVEIGYGIKLPRSAAAINVILACSLVHFYPPKYHARALRSLDSLLEQDENQVDCRIARGYTHQYARRWEEARQDFDKVLTLVEESDPVWLEAAEESAWCQVQLGQKATGIESLNSIIEKLDQCQDADTAQARARWRLGKAIWDEASEDSILEAYKLWIAALKRSSAFAPAYTSLGIYYAEHVKPPDATRASKCFQKAFELDAREAEAARRLAEGFVEEQEWDLAEIIARRTIAGEGGVDTEGQGTKESLISRHIPTNVWAWKVAGMVALQKRNYPEAIQSLQIALRSSSEDGVTWLRLGEAYAGAGRFTASLKALARAEKLLPDSQVCQFQIAEVTRDLGDFQTSIDILSNAIAANPLDATLHAARCTARLALARSEQSKGFLERGYSSCVDTVEEAINTLKLEAPTSRVIWKIITDASFDLARKPLPETDMDNRAKLALGAVIQQLLEHKDLMDQRVIHLVNLESVLSECDENTTDVEVEFIAVKASVVAASYSVHLAGNDDATLGPACYDAAVTLLELANNHATLIQPADVAVAWDLATEYVKRAIRSQATEPLYWNCLGTLTLDSNPRLSQHSFIRAIQCESKDPSLWCNLGFLYVEKTDLHLAQEAFHRAQILDPDYAMSWVGQAVVASGLGDSNNSAILLGHAVSLSADLPIPNLEFAYRAFRSFLTSSKISQTQSDLGISAFFALERCLQRRSKDATALHLASLISERLGLRSRAVIFARRSAKILESAYERAEDPQTARRYAITQSTLGRILLSEGSYNEACDSFEIVLSLVEKADDSEKVDQEATRLRSQAHIAIGLARLLLGEVEIAIASFETATEETPVSFSFLRTRATILLAQTMWMLGTEEAQEAAKSLLLESIGADSKNIDAMVVLGAIATLLEDEALLDAALSEIISMPPQERRRLDRLHKVDALLLRHHLIRGSLAEAIELTRQTVGLDPQNHDSRLQLCNLLLRNSDPSAALEALGTDSDNIPIASAQLRLKSLANLTIESTDISKHTLMTQEAIFLVPWEDKNWLGLAYARAKGSADA